MSSRKKTPVHIPGAPQRKVARRTAEVTFEPPALALEYKFFNCYCIEKKGDFVHLQLFYREGDRLASQLHGVISVHDCKTLIPKFREYIAQLAPIPETFEFSRKHDLPFTAPDSFHHFDLARRDDLGELMINQLSHRSLAHAVAKSLPEIPRVKVQTRGMFTSSLAVHKSLVWEFLELFES